MKDANFSSLVGKTLTRCEQVGDDKIIFVTDDGHTFQQHHYQDCCESVSVEDIAGDLADLVGSPILQAEVSSNSDDPAKGEWDESYTWTFYKLATIKGSVTIRWYGTSNGYYSEGVDFEEVS
jgi:hypothetical protein